MGLDVSLKLKNKNTGETRELSDYGGSNFNFIKDYANHNNLYGKDIEITAELGESFILRGLKILRENGFETSELGEDYGLMGFIKNLHLANYYERFGYTLFVNADW